MSMRSEFRFTIEAGRAMAAWVTSAVAQPSKFAARRRVALSPTDRPTPTWRPPAQDEDPDCAHDLGGEWDRCVPGSATRVPGRSASLVGRVLELADGLTIQLSPAWRDAAG